LDTDPLARASFEKTIEQLILAGIFNEVDHMKSVSSRIMAGKVIKGGTGLCQIMLDSELLENSEYVEDDETVKTFTELTHNVYIKDILSRLGEDGDFNLPF
jgi:DNA-directed RNA polymerase beta' subunit